MAFRGRRSNTPARPASAWREAQTDLFPEKPVIDELDPLVAVGPRTGVLAMVRVVLRASEAPHLVFHDRHGWYCEEHGPTCAAVGVARDAVSGP